MNNNLIDRLNELSKRDFAYLLRTFDDFDFEYARKKAREITDKTFGKQIFIRGLIEISNICKNDCYYCGIRRSNGYVQRYRLDKEEILDCCKIGYKKGFRTFVLQGGEDGYFNDDTLCDIISKIKTKYSDCAVTLSLGERKKESYQRLFDAGADRYLLRHETAEKSHYEKLHPQEMSFENRMICLENLKEIGYQTGCGMMVGSPFQTEEELADDLLFIRRFKPQMIGIGPFIPADNTPFSHKKTGNVKMTLYIISLLRIMLPFALIPATTALQTLCYDGRIMAINHGANVIMPNLSPMEQRKKYQLYENKEKAFFDTAEELNIISSQLNSAGYSLSVDRGDYKENERKN